MSFLLIPAGILLLGLVLFDIIITTFAPVGAGVLTSRFNSFFWKVIFAAAGHNPRSTFLDYSGTILCISTVVLWILLVWLANSLLLLGDPGSVVHAQTKIPANPVEKIYFAGYCLSSLGLGDFVPKTGFWKLYTSFISFTGFAIITMAITYFVPVISANTEQRTTNLLITTIGDTPQEILINTWNGENFERLIRHLEQVHPDIIQNGEKLLAYPVLHYFHSHKKTASSPLAISVLDEALSLLINSVPQQARGADKMWHPYRQSSRIFTGTLTAAFIKKADEAPPLPDLQPLREAGIPLLPQEEIKAKFEKDADRRKALEGYVMKTGWKWEDVFAQGDNKNQV